MTVSYLSNDPTMPHDQMVLKEIYRNTRKIERSNEDILREMQSLNYNIGKLIELIKKSKVKHKRDRSKAHIVTLGKTKRGSKRLDKLRTALAARR